MSTIRKAKVWNDHTRPYSEKYQDNVITIAPKGFVVMDKPDADIFLGQYIPIRKDGQGNALNAKMLRIEVMTQEEALAAESNICNACGQGFADKTELNSHSNLMHAHMIKKEE